MTPAQRKQLARLALQVPRPMGRLCKTVPDGLERLEAYVEQYAFRAREGLALKMLSMPQYPDPRRPWWARWWTRVTG